jgi:hypothetical protein
MDRRQGSFFLRSKWEMKTRPTPRASLQVDPLYFMIVWLAKRELWFAEKQLAALSQRGLKPSDLQCIGFKTPVVFAESRSVPDNSYVADLYEQVSFLGDLHRQIANVPNGGTVRLKAGQPPTDP